MCKKKTLVQAVRERGVSGSELPARSALAVTVPGAAALWEDTIKTFGKLSLAEVRRPTCLRVASANSALRHTG